MAKSFDLKHDAYRIHWPENAGEACLITMAPDGNTVHDIMPEQPFVASLIFSLANRVTDAEALLVETREDMEQPTGWPDHEPDLYDKIKAFLDPEETKFIAGSRDEWLVEHGKNILEVLEFARAMITQMGAADRSYLDGLSGRDTARIHAIEEIFTRYSRIVTDRGLEITSDEFKTLMAIRQGKVVVQPDMMSFNHGDFDAWGWTEWFVVASAEGYYCARRNIDGRTQKHGPAFESEEGPETTLTRYWISSDGAKAQAKVLNGG